MLLENGHGRELRKIRKLLTCEEFDAEEENKLEMFLSENLGELSNGRVKKAYAAMLSAHQNGLSCSKCYKEMGDPVDVCTCSSLIARCMKVSLTQNYYIDNSRKLKANKFIV